MFCELNNWGEVSRRSFRLSPVPRLPSLLSPSLAKTKHELSLKIMTPKTGFDPTLSIKTLEKAISLLLPLRKFNAIKMTEMERKVVLAERGYRGDVRGAKAGFEVRAILLYPLSIDFGIAGGERGQDTDCGPGGQTVNTQFQTLDTKIGNVGRTAVRIGLSPLGHCFASSTDQG